MPTAAKLVAATIFALVAFLAAHLFIPALPEGTQVGRFREISAFLGAVCGWIVMGSLVSRGKGRENSYLDAIGSGIRTSVVILFWGLMVFSIYEMLQRSVRMLYDGPMEALLGILELMYDYGKLLQMPNTPIALVSGGIVGGIFSEWAARRWP